MDMKRPPAGATGKITDPMKSTADGGMIKGKGMKGDVRNPQPANGRGGMGGKKGKK